MVDCRIRLVPPVEERAERPCKKSAVVAPKRRKLKLAVGGEAGHFQTQVKIAEALILRADLQKKHASLRERIGKNAVVQEGNDPHEDPNKLLKEAFGVLKELRELIGKINAANARQKLPDGRTLTAAIAQRDEFAQQHSLLQHAITHSSKEPERYSMAEIKWVTCVDVQKLQKQSDDLAKKIRELNILIQDTNWKSNLE